jgi:hypothetical protein
LLNLQHWITTALPKNNSEKRKLYSNLNFGDYKHCKLNSASNLPDVQKDIRVKVCIRPSISNRHFKPTSVDSGHGKGKTQATYERL